MLIAVWRGAKRSKCLVSWLLIGMICNTNGYVLFQIFPFLTTTLLGNENERKNSRMSAANGFTSGSRWLKMYVNNAQNRKELVCHYH